MPALSKIQVAQTGPPWGFVDARNAIDRNARTHSSRLTETHIATLGTWPTSWKHGYFVSCTGGPDHDALIQQPDVHFGNRFGFSRRYKLQRPSPPASFPPIAKTL